MIIFKKNTEWGNDENDILYLMIEFNDELQRCSPVDRYRSWWLLTEPTPHRVHLVLPHPLQRRRRGRVSCSILIKGGMKKNSFIMNCSALIFFHFVVEWIQLIPMFSEVEKQNCLPFKSHNFKKQNYSIKCMLLHIKYLLCNQKI